MMDLNNILQILKIIGAILVALATIITATLTIYKGWIWVCNTIVKPFWNKVLKPCVKILIFVGTQVIPISIIVWIMLYVAATNSDRLTEPSVFLSLIVQATMLISLYSIGWGMWIWPFLLQPLFVKQKRNVQQLSSNQQDSDNGQEPSIESPS